MPWNDATNFSLVDGGSTHRLLKRFLREGNRDHLFLKVAGVCALVTWLPLLLLSIAEGVAWGGKVTIPFLYDVAAFTRFLIALPLLIIAESVIGPRLAEVATHFIDSGRIRQSDHRAYEAAVDEAVRLRDSVWAEVAVLVIAYLSTFTSLLTLALTVPNWRWTATDSAVHFTLGAWWYAGISIPIFQFVLYRWFLRMFIWSRFMYRMSRLDLNLKATHPDRAAGIAFVGANQRFFGIIAFALGSVFAGIGANEILYEGVPLDSFRVPAIAIAVVLVFLIQMPGIFFFSMLRKTKRRGVFVYGTLALQYTTKFQEKWADGDAPKDEELIGSGDIQSLADLGNSYAVIDDMKIVPFTLKSSIWLIVAFLAPVLPLQLTAMPIDEILDKALRLIT